MASSNRHWPSLFKSKPCSTHHHQWQHDINHPSSLLSSSCQKSSPFSPAPAGEERTPEPKPRWNPKPEQIRILEAIFNSGMVNPPRDEIRKIRAQLQEYGQVGDANVFYWFQNRKSRSKHKQRQLQSASAAAIRSHSRSNSTPTANAAASQIAAPTSSSSSSSDRSSGSEKTPPPPPPSMAALTSIVHASASPPLSVNQTYSQTPVEFPAEPFFFQAPPQGYYFSDLVGIVGMPEQASPAVCSGMLWSELMGQDAKLKMQSQQGYDGAAVANSAIAVPSNTDVSPAGAGTGPITAAAFASASAAAATIYSPVNEIQGVGGAGAAGGMAAAPARSTVFINEVAFEVSPSQINVREAFGEGAILLHASGHPVLTDEWGLTLQPLQHGASYYLV